MEGLIVNNDFVAKLAQAMPVSTDPSQWPKEALNEFLAQFPEFTNEDLRVQLTRKNPEKGYAVGAILFREGTIAVPIIIKGFSMSSFDVVVAINRIMPLTRENLFTLFSNKQAYGSLAPIDTGGDFISMFDPALRAAAAGYGSTTYNLKSASAESEDYSFIDRLSDSTTAKVKNQILTHVEADPQIKRAFELNKTTDILEKVATLKENDKIDVNKSLSHSLDRDIHYIYKTGADKYIGIFGSSQAYDPVTVDMTKNEAEDFESFKLAKCSTKSGKTDKKKRKLAVFSILDDKINKLIITEEGKYAEVAPYERFEDTYEASEDSLEAKIPEAGKTYVMKIGDNVTRPWDVINTTFLGGSQFKVDIANGLEKRAYYITKGINGVFPHETEKNAFYIGDSAEWYEISGNIDLDKPVVEYLDTVTKVSETMYEFTGPNLSKYASDYVPDHNLSFHEAVWGLIQSKADITALSKFSELQPGQKAEFRGLVTPPSLEKFANLVQEEYNERFGQDYGQSAYLFQLVKIAADNPLKTTVDAVLSLGFINKDNIEEYVAQVPMYEQVCSDLAKLLLYIRLGMESTPEEPVRKAMKELTKVVERLRGLGKLNKIE